MDQIIFKSREEFEAFYKANCADARRHWYYGPIETQGTANDVFTLKEAYDDAMSMDDETLFGTEGYFELWDVDDASRAESFIVALKNGSLYALGQVKVNDEDEVAEKYEALGFERASEKAFSEDLADFGKGENKGYFAFVAKETFRWLDNRHGFSGKTLDEEEYPF